MTHAKPQHRFTATEDAFLLAATDLRKRLSNKSLASMLNTTPQSIEDRVWRIRRKREDGALNAHAKKKAV